MKGRRSRRARSCRRPWSARDRCCPARPAQAGSSGGAATCGVSFGASDSWACRTPAPARGRAAVHRISRSLRRRRCERCMGASSCLSLGKAGPHRCESAGRKDQGPLVAGPGEDGAGEESRTPDLRITNALLSPTELHRRKPAIIAGLSQVIQPAWAGPCRWAGVEAEQRMALLAEDELGDRAVADAHVEVDRRRLGHAQHLATAAAIGPPLETISTAPSHWWRAHGRARHARRPRSRHGAACPAVACGPPSRPAALAQQPEMARAPASLVSGGSGGGFSAATSASPSYSFRPGQDCARRHLHALAMLASESSWRLSVPVSAASKTMPDSRKNSPRRRHWRRPRSLRRS